MPEGCKAKEQTVSLRQSIMQPVFQWVHLKLCLSYAPFSQSSEYFKTAKPTGTCPFTSADKESSNERDSQEACSYSGGAAVIHSLGGKTLSHSLQI